MTEDHTQRAHARLAPSAAHRWCRCPGSVRLSAGLEEAPSVYAAEGTAAHMLAEKCLSAGFDAERFKGHTIGGFVVDADMIDAVQTFLDLAREIQAESDEFEIEQRLDMTDFVDDVFGTGDCVAYFEAAKRVTIADYKHGKGVAVEVRANEQMLTYALGVANRYHNRGVDEVELIVCQPRAPHRDGPVRRWVTDIVTLHEHAIAIQTAAELAQQPDAPLVPGEWCRFCKAAGICPALHETAMQIVGANIVDGDVMGLDPIEKYSPEELAAKLKALPLVANWCKRLEEFAHLEATRGRMPPGFKLVAKRANRSWKDPEIAAQQLSLLGVDEGELYETKMRSPAQVEKALPKKERSVIGDLSESKSSGTVLAPLDDSRPAVDPHDARGFEAVEIEERG